MRLASFLAAALALAITGPVHAQSWDEYTNREDHFTVNFPGDPTVEKITYKTEKGTSLPGNVYTAKDARGGEYLELIGCLYHLDPKTAATRRRELLELFGLLGNEQDRMSEYSKGMRQKTAIIGALMHRPEVLIMDEPLDGLDANAAMIVKELLKQMAAQGKTVLFCSHILEVVDRMCTKIVVINHGRMVASGTSDELKQQTGQTSLDAAFGKLTGGQDVGRVAADFLSALEK